MRRALRGDLDTIVLKALKKRPQDRYATVNALADDITRHLEHGRCWRGPTAAGTAWANSWRATAWPVAAAAGATSAAVVGTAAFALLQMVEANTQRDLAEKQSQRMELTNEFLEPGTRRRRRLGKTAVAGGKSRSHHCAHGKPLRKRRDGIRQHVVPGRVALRGHRSRRIASCSCWSAWPASGRKLGDADILASAQCSAAEAVIDSNQESAKNRLAEVDALIASGRPLSQSTQWDCERARAALLEAAGDRKTAIARLERTLATQSGGTAMPVMTRVGLLDELGHLKFRNDDAVGCVPPRTRPSCCSTNQGAASR